MLTESPSAYLVDQHHERQRSDQIDKVESICPSFYLGHHIIPTVEFYCGMYHLPPPSIRTELMICLISKSLFALDIFGEQDMKLNFIVTIVLVLGGTYFLLGYIVWAARRPQGAKLWQVMASKKTGERWGLSSS